MKLHKRTMLVQRAGADLAATLIDWIQRHDLTWAEVVSLLSQQLIRFTNHLIRSERHPNDPDKKADEA